MSLKKILQVGEKIEVCYQGENIDSEKRNCYSMVQDIVGQDEIIITAPMLQGNQMILSIGQKVEIIFFREKGQFIFEAEVIDRFKKENINLLKLNVVSSIKRIQRRNYYRLKITLPIYIRSLTDGSEENQNSEKWFKAYTLDISGGGVKISIDRSLEKGSLLECKLKINDEDLVLKGKVVRCQLAETDPIIRYEIGMSFVDITEYQRDLIIRFIFEEQRKLRKKGFI